MERICVVVLAGGEGRRMGGDKAGRRLAGATLLDRALARARGLSSEVGLSVRDPGGLRGPDGVELLLDDPAISGPIAGLASALRFAGARGCEAVLTLPVDTPFLPDDLLPRLREALAGEAACAVARSGERLHPTCALWRAGLGEALSGYVAEGRRSLMGFGRAIGMAEAAWPAEPLDPFMNINTPDDLHEAERLMGASASRAGA